MNLKLAYLIFEQALMRIQLSPEEDPNGYLSRFISEMDVTRNLAKYKIWESENPEITLLYKKRIDAVGFDSDKYGYYTIKGFAETLGLLHGQVPNSFYDENRLSPSDEKAGIDLPEKAARIFFDQITMDQWIIIASHLIADLTIKEVSWLLKQMYNVTGNSNVLSSLKFLRDLGMDSFSHYLKVNNGIIDNEYLGFLNFLKEKEMPSDLLAFIERIGSTPFSLIQENFSWFAYNEMEGIPEKSVSMNPQKALEELKPLPTNASIALLLLVGYKIQFAFNNNVYETSYPFSKGPALLLKKQETQWVLQDKVSINGLLTQPRFYIPGYKKAFTLMKAIHTSTDIELKKELS